MLPGDDVTVSVDEIGIRHLGINAHEGGIWLLTICIDFRDVELQFVPRYRSFVDTDASILEQ